MSFEVRVQPGDEVFSCPPDRPILNAAHAANILISSSCRSGQCGSCLGRVISGRVEYPDGPPAAISETETAAGLVLFCSAYALSDLVIELIQPDF